MFSFITMLVEALVNGVDSVRHRRALERQAQIEAAEAALRKELEAEAAARTKSN